jgi:hypothetical protein
MEYDERWLHDAQSHPVHATESCVQLVISA